MLLFSLLVLGFAALIAFTYRTKTNKIHNQIIRVKEVSSKTIETNKAQLMSMNPFETLWVDQDKFHFNEMTRTDEKELKQNAVKSLTNDRKTVTFKQINDLAKTKRALKTLFDTN